jgi:hypothetical protein
MKAGAEWLPFVLAPEVAKEAVKPSKSPFSADLSHSKPNINAGKVSSLPPPTCYCKNREKKLPLPSVPLGFVMLSGALAVRARQSKHLAFRRLTPYF